MNRFLKKVIITMLCIGLLFSGVGILDGNKLNAAETLDVTLSAHTDGYGSVSLDWSNYDYQDKNFKVYKSDDGGKTYETVGIDYTLVDEVKCLQIWPIPNAAYQLKTWMETNNYGKGIIKIDSVYIDYFNANPDTYLKDSDGNYKYDVIFFGAWDSYNNKDLTQTSMLAVEKYIKTGRGCIFGHDVVAFNPDASIGRKFNILAPYCGLTFHDKCWYNCEWSSNVKIIKKGLFTNYPWNIGEIGTILTIPPSHNIGQCVDKATKWLEFYGSTYTNQNYNYYLATYNNCASIMTGHSNGAATVDEQKILANLIFYCNQLIFNTWYSKDSSAQDLANPDSPVVDVTGNKFTWNATDNGSTYHYYVESFDKNDTTSSGMIDRSPVKSLTVTTGTKKYRYILDNNANTTVTLSNGTETTDANIPANRNYNYLHVAAIDGAGNLGATTTVAIPKIADYKINHYKMDLNGNYVLEHTETYSGIIGTNVENHIESCEGFTSPSEQTMTIKADGSTVINYYYERNKYDATYIDMIDSISGIQLGRTVQKVYYDSLVYGGDLGNNIADNAYYNGYYYIEDTSAKVTTNGAIVYRIFKLKTIDISGTVSWNDNSNKYQTRPDTVTVRLYRNGEEIDSVTVNTDSNVSTYSFTNLPQYNAETGEEYVYTVSQDTIYSQAALTTTEDKYTTTQDSYNFLNTISNTDGDEPEVPDTDRPDDKGFYVSGNIYWNDRNDKLGFRPNEVTITLYQKGENGEWEPFREPITVDSKTENKYSFDWLPKYWYDASGTPNAYEYKVEESFSSWYVKDGEMVDAYIITPDSPNKFDFTNTLHVVNPDVPNSEYNNTLVIKTNIEEEVRVVLKPLKPVFDEELNVFYGDYSGNDVSVFTDNVGTVVDKLSPTRYEIVIDSIKYTLDNIKLSLPQNVELENIDGKWYITIGNQPEDAFGTIEIELTKKEDFYQGRAGANNYFSVSIRTKEVPVIKKMSLFIARPEAPVTVEYMDSSTEDSTLYSSSEQAEILDFFGVIPTNTEFIGWSMDRDSETAEYLTGDMATMESENIVLYPVFKENSNMETEIEVETETDSSKQSEEPVIIEIMN